MFNNEVSDSGAEAGLVASHNVVKFNTVVLAAKKDSSLLKKLRTRASESVSPDSGKLMV